MATWILDLAPLTLTTLERHMAVQEWIREQRPDLNTLYSPDFILRVHHEIYVQVPESLWQIKDAQGKVVDTVVPGA